MESSEPASIALLTAADLPDCLALSTQAGWNQSEADWRIFFELGRVWGIREETQVVATAALLPYPPSTAWVSMVLTAGPSQGQGYASRLVARVLNHCEEKRLAPQLDATAAGEGVYARLGFQTLSRLTRWRRTLRDRPEAKARKTAEIPDNIDDLDAAAIGFARSDVLRSLSHRGPNLVSETGFALSRKGREAQHIGPLVAPDRQTAESLLSAMMDQLGAVSSVIIDANDEAEAFCALLPEFGFEPERAFARMALGSPPRAKPTLYLASAGPELG
ncbi:MAG: GNAT family N-acetyltransferase [Kiloniellales bacterium]